MYEGYAIGSSIKSMPIAGRDITKFVQELLTEHAMRELEALLGEVLGPGQPQALELLWVRLVGDVRVGEV